MLASRASIRLAQAILAAAIGVTLLLGWKAGLATLVLAYALGRFIMFMSAVLEEPFNSEK